MTRRRQMIAAAAAAGVLTLGPLALRADAHDEVGHDATCESVSGSFANFPGNEGAQLRTHTIRVSGDGGAPVLRTFTGSSGSVTATWEALGVDVTDGAVHTYGFAWTADGGGSAGPFTFDAEGCVPPVTTPPTTVPPELIPPAVIDREHADPADPAEVDPTFTG